MDADFFERWPLYKTAKYDSVLVSMHLESVPALHLQCSVCKVDRTFTAGKAYPSNNKAFDITAGHLVLLSFNCAACGNTWRHYLLAFSERGVMKVGQSPPPEIDIGTGVTKFFGRERAALMRKGAMVESEGFGIGAYAYYRQVVESVVDDLLDAIGELIEEEGGAEKDAYHAALEKTKMTIVAQDKLDLVKGLVPASLRPGGVNPLGVLYHELSEGIHDKTDEECLDKADAVRRTLIYLVERLVRAKREAMEFSEGMKKLLAKKAKPVSSGDADSQPAPAVKNSGT